MSSKCLIGLLQSSPPLPQRADARSNEMFDFMPLMVELLLTSRKPTTVCSRVRLAGAALDDEPARAIQDPGLGAHPCGAL